MIGDKIKEIRLNKKISQKNFAKILEMPISTLANYENNHREPNIDTLNKIATALNVTISDLINDDTVNLNDEETIDFLFDLFNEHPELKPLLPIFKNKGYELRIEIKDSDVFLIKDKKAIAKIPEKDFIDFGTRMINAINEFNDFELNKFIDIFTFLD